MKTWAAFAWWAATAAAAALGTAAAAAQAPDEHYAGIAYAAAGGKPVYREEHWVYQEGGAARRLVLYRCPQAPYAPFARKRVEVLPGGSPYAPDFDLLDARTGYREGVRQAGGARQVYVQEKAGAAMKTAALPARAGAVIDAGFDAYVRGHWDLLAGKGSATVPFLVPSRLDYLNLSLGGGTAVQVDGRDALRLRMKLDAWYGFAAPSLDIFYSMPGRRLLRFHGISNIRDEAGNSQAVRIDFPADMQFPAPARADMEQAAALPLSTHCP
jgi:hypothetical protein